MIRILIADEHDVVRAGLRGHLEAQPSWEVIAEAADGKEAILKAIETKPDVLVLAYSLPVLNGAEVTRQVLAQLPKTEVLIYTMRNVESLMDCLLKAGVRGCVLKSELIGNVIDAVRSVAAHKPYFTHMASLDEARRKRSGSLSVLTVRERTVVQLMADGNTNKEVARILGISLKTVETHRSNIMKKLQLSSSADLVRYAVRNEIIAA